MLSDYKCLALNSDYKPLSIYPISLMNPQEALKVVMRGKATVVEEYDRVIQSANHSIRIPKVIAMNTWVDMYAKPKFCRRSIFLRDRFKCQYCGDKFTTDELTFDHLIPRAQGGKTAWDNIVTACASCNALKRDQMPNFSGKKGKAGGGLRPFKMPRQPSSMELMIAGLELLDEDVKEDFKDYLYWMTELDE